MGFNVRVFDKRTESEIDSDRIGFIPMTDPEHRGRKHIIVRNPNNGDAENIAIFDEDGKVDCQPGWEVRVTRES